MLIFDEHGLDPEASAIIMHRLRVIGEIYVQVASQKNLVPVADNSPLYQQILALETPEQDEVYSALAGQLGFVYVIQQRSFLRFWRSGMLSSTIWPTYARVKKHRIGHYLEDIERRFVAVLSISEYVTDWIKGLSQQQICRDDDAARRVAYELNQINSAACRQSKDIIRTWGSFGVIGLLKYSEYPCFDELMMAYRQASNIIAAQGSLNILPKIYEDIISLYRSFHHPGFENPYHEVYGFQAKVWDQSLLHQPSDSVSRKQALQAIGPLKHLLIPVLSDVRGCDRPTAVSLINEFLHRGLPGLIDFRCHEHNTDMVSSSKSIINSVSHLLKAIQTNKRDQILSRLAKLQNAVAKSGASFPLSNLIRHLPSSRYRKKRQRRKIPETLISAFALEEGIEESTAQAYIKNFLIYGPLGLLPKREWSQAIHPRLWSYLHMFKLGRLEDTINLSTITERVNSYAHKLGVEPLPKQIISGILSHFPKPRYYNSGDGEAIAGVPLRKALKLAGVSRLHEQWLIVPVELDIELLDLALRPLGNSCWVLLVIDCGSQRPVGLWITDRDPSSNDAGLALYDAIFHRVSLHWPLRGIPENILLPKNLLEGADNLYQAALFLMAEIKLIEKPEALLRNLPYAKQMIQDLGAQYIPAYLPGRRRSPRVQKTIQQAENEIREWLYKSCFPNHRTDPVPAGLRKQGFALPGYDTPAAGWLLPIHTECETVRGGIELRHLTYSDQDTGIEPGIRVDVRLYPERAGRVRSVFVEYMVEGDIILHYLRLLPKE